MGPSRRKRFWIVFGTVAGNAFWLWGFWVYANAHPPLNRYPHGVARLGDELELVRCPNASGIGSASIIEGDGYEGDAYWSAQLAPTAPTADAVPLAGEASGYVVSPAGEFQAGHTYTVIEMGDAKGFNLLGTVLPFVPDQIASGQILDGRGKLMVYDEWLSDVCTGDT